MARNSASEGNVFCGAIPASRSGFVGHSTLPGTDGSCVGSAGTALLAWVESGKAVKNLLASRASTAGSGTPAGKSFPLSHTSLQTFSRSGPGASGSLGVMVVSDIDVFEHSD